MPFQKPVIETTVKTKHSHRVWQLIPHPVHPDCFILEEAKTGKILCSLALPEGGNPTFLNRIAAAPELEDIAEMYRDHMTGNEAEKTMVFSMVITTLERAAQPYRVEKLEGV